MNKVYGNCEICGEEIALGYMTEYEDGRYLCISCQIDSNNKISRRQILLNRRNEILSQLYDIDVEIGNDNRIEII